MGLEHVMMVEVEERIGSYREPKVVLFNINRVTQREALDSVYADRYNENVLCIPRSQFVALFRDGKEI